MSWNLTYGMRNVSNSSDQIGKEMFISNYLEELPSRKQLELFTSTTLKY
jgi:DNA adenine methylase